MMKRRELLTVLASSVALAAAGPMVAAPAWVNSVNQSFNSVQTAFAPFVQTNPNGSQVKGRFYLYRPGRMRFEYESPSQPMMVADGTVIAVFDPKSNTGPKKYPQVDSPLSLLAKSNLDLTSNRYVRKLTQKGDEALIEVSDPNKQQYGSLILRINYKTNRLRGWQVIDKGGNRTTIDLLDFHSGVSMNPDLFNIVKIQNAQ